ncbi:MAG TPA: hypothetical protein DDW50_10730 [Firmicutes bacterium]|nr:hypothetical protein [Bacillota bacterium]
MKKCLSPDDLRELSETQKSALQHLWRPSKYDLAFEIVWRDVENDSYDIFLVMILDARVMNTPGNCGVILKVYYPSGAPHYELEEAVSLGENDSEDEDERESDNFPDSFTESDSDTGSQVDNVEPTELAGKHYLNVENCLPTLNIGQMIEILRENKGEPNISFTPEEAICYIDGTEYSGEELCDALWEAVKDLL